MGPLAALGLIYQQLTKANKMTSEGFEWLECICDINGNFRNPGYDADYYRHSSGRCGIMLGGDWEFYDSRFADIVHWVLWTDKSVDELHRIFDGTFAEIYAFVSTLEKDQ